MGDFGPLSAGPWAAQLERKTRASRGLPGVLPSKAELMNAGLPSRGKAGCGYKRSYPSPAWWAGHWACVGWSQSPGQGLLGLLDASGKRSHYSI